MGMFASGEASGTLISVLIFFSFCTFVFFHVQEILFLVASNDRA